MLDPAYRLRTPRLCLRCWNPDDAPLLHAAVTESRAHLTRFIPWAADEPLDLEERVAFLRRARARFDADDEYVYGVFDLEERRVLGGAGLHRRIGPGAFEIGYWVHVAEVNQGLATELASALTQAAFVLHRAERVEIHHDPDNFQSARVPEKLGFTRDATLRARAKDAKGSPRDTTIWSMLRAEFPSSPAARLTVEAFDSLHRPMALVLDGD